MLGPFPIMFEKALAIAADAEVRRMSAQLPLVFGVPEYALLLPTRETLVAANERETKRRALNEARLRFNERNK